MQLLSCVDVGENGSLVSASFHLLKCVTFDSLKRRAAANE